MKKRLGIDLGSIYLKMVVLDDQDNIQFSTIKHHQGNPVKAVKEIVQENNLGGDYHLGIVGLNGPLLASQFNLNPLNDIQAHITAVKKFYPNVRNIISIGGSSTCLIELDEKGDFRNYNSNSLCAAGTGSFLDQQAERMGIDYNSLKDFAGVDDPPSIAARCAVFAKTDLIHRQQEGYSKHAMWSGLCKGLNSALTNTLLRGRALNGLTVLVGGVAQNKELVKWFKKEYGEQVQTFELAPFAGALGAAYLTNGSCKNLSDYSFLVETEKNQESLESRKPLLLNKSKWPSFEVAESYLDKNESEVRITKLPEEKLISSYIGIDVGSTSTKVVITDENGDILVDIYRKTLSDPIKAAQFLFMAIEELLEKKKKKLNILGAATTGSGRKLVGAIIGVDIVVNEISAHVKGALRIDPEIETIFEVGGQDSKYMRIKNGFINDANMNYVCAAGTGSFVEEQAKKLGFTLDEIGDMVMGILPQTTSDRCTVFMEQDIHKLIRQGYTKKEAMASVMYSVVQNYLNKVVGRRFVSKEKIFFQGATARNKGLVAAFENLLDIEIVISPYCHVLGAHGSALLVKDSMDKKRKASSFKGLDLASREIKLEEKRCEFCSNKCKITYAHIEGEKETPSYGYMCGKDPDGTKQKSNDNFSVFKIREKIFNEFSMKVPQSEKRNKISIGVPIILSNLIYYPLWKAFFNSLGFNVKTISKTSEEIVESGIKAVGADYCFPIKVSYGHVKKLISDESIDYLFLPHMMAAKPNEYTVRSCFCPYIQTFPSHVKNSEIVNSKNVNKLIDPVIDFNSNDKKIIEHLFKSFKKLGVGHGEIKIAFKKATDVFESYQERCQKEGERILEKLDSENETAVVILGRIYNTVDERISLNLPKKISEAGVKVIPIDLVPFNPKDLGEVFSNMYWTYGQWIINAAKMIAKRKNLYAIYLSNYSCGPDSFITTLVSEIMGEKPMLMLELDEHSGDAGYMTRVEAFLDVIGQSPVKVHGFNINIPKLKDAELRKKTIWIPNMHPVACSIISAAFRRHGYKSELIVPENEDSIKTGRSLTNGSECLPMIVTLGSFVNKIRSLNSKGEDHVLFMPAANGPCRFGQYALTQKILFNRIGYEDLGVLSPTSENTYEGVGLALAKSIWDAVIISDILFKIRCRIKPYEKNQGETEKILEKSIKRIKIAFEKKEKLEKAFLEVMKWFEAIEHHPFYTKPLVGIVGEIFVRCNTLSNNKLVEEIEKSGAEAWLTSTSEWFLFVSLIRTFEAKEYNQGLYKRVWGNIRNKILHIQEKHWLKMTKSLLENRLEPSVEAVVNEGLKYLKLNFSTEALLTIGRTIKFKEQGANIVVNVSPFACMPGTISSSIFQKVETDYNMSIINMFYDGKDDMKPHLNIFLENMKKNLN